MIASIDDSIGMLSKWQSERKSLSVTLVMDGLMFVFDGFVKSITSDHFSIGECYDTSSNYPVGTRSECDLTINLEKVRSVAYGEPRRPSDSIMGDSSKQYVSSLTFTLSVAGKLVLHERTK
jgi:hypothetical protein